MDIDMAKRGRPSKYKPEYAEQARKLCLLGATDKDLAGFFSVSEVTINSWKDKHPDFLESLKAAKKESDARVVKSLFQRAIGYEHPEDKIFNDQGEPLIVPTIKHYPPDTTAAIFWLKNRQPDEWRDTKHLDVTRNTKTIDDLSEAELLILAAGGEVEGLSDWAEPKKVH